LKSAFLSISINGKSQGYFNCSRGVRQGDPLSPLLFCLAEEVLSRGITRLVSQGILQLIKGTRDVCVPSHSFYADDLLIFCKGYLSGLRALKDLFETYALASGQVINNLKSTIIAGAIAPRRLDDIIQLLQFNTGSLPFNYLGVPIFKGRPKVIHLQPIADKVKLKLAAWKASLLSIAGRVQLVRSVIQSMLTYSISLYSWPISLLRDLERCIRNFIWSGDINKRKLVTVAWHKICRPLTQGGLNLRSLIRLNSACNLKLCWKFFNSQSSWAILLRARVWRHKRIIQHHISSSIWSSIKDEVNVVLDNSLWLLGNGEHINFWTDNWLGTPLVDQLLIPQQVRASLSASVKDFIVDGRWSLPPTILQLFPILGNILNEVSIPIMPTSDTLLWHHTDSGDLELKQAYEFKSQQYQELHWAKLIWIPEIPPSKSLLVWRLMLGKVPTDENLISRGCSIPSMCSLCQSHAESSHHLFFECIYAVRLWSWLASCLNMTIQLTSMEDVWKLCDLGWSPQSKITITAALVNLLNVIWHVRNQARFHHVLIPWKAAIALIISYTSLAGNNTCKTASNSLKDFVFLKSLRVTIHPSRVSMVKEVLWQPPLMQWIKCNIDGSSIPGNSACGGLFRDHNADFLYGFAEPLGITNSLVAELNGAMRAIEIAIQHNWMKLWLETDSTTVVEALTNTNKQVPWFLRNRWLNMKARMLEMDCVITHIYREGNQPADILANHGLTIHNLSTWEEAPLFLHASLERNKFGFPCFRHYLM
jgi:mannosylglycoprotein endo-beta-mannosidase